MQIFDAVIIGAGQCGLYTAKKLQDDNKHYVVLERHAVGQVWLRRLEGMRLFTSRQFSQLPGLTFTGDGNGFPDVKEMANYLKAYAAKFKLNIRENAEVETLTKVDGKFLITLQGGQEIQAKTVINATGSNQVPIVPEMSKSLSEHIIQYTADITSLNTIIDNSRVVVVGDGATGRQIAARLANRCQVVLATGSSRGLPPNTILGKDIFWWLKKIGILDASNTSLVAKILKKRNPVPCAEFNNTKLKKLGVTIKPRAINCDKDTIIFKDGEIENVDIVIWAVGYKDETSWLKIYSCFNKDGFIHDKGVTPEPGLFVIGRKWLSSRGSELILGVEKDVNSLMLDFYDFENKNLDKVKS
ncbi:NAD(P)/FAD-dependent oxidoreductase [Rheinheimera sp. MMS21-TC3]|uniref:flavin-containing monooxygenase n=1 Tax=Rheinheimera sp. MMS21-TC3 TaxID=3072790 RepID=UPI0028C41C39|nr:NAD(P)/FAD-dependent oxidoreductase [Rheinheimera sp. MMS21-TC3]WNO60628.1 NAD(P)/FAD-dependent oxidoreductase [Rheinheimera sp. MMS21-TC3]